jgi:hypothetical protein
MNQMTAKIRTSAKSATAQATKLASLEGAEAVVAGAKVAARKRPAKAPAASPAAVEAKGGAKVPSEKVAAAIALAGRPEGVTLAEVAKLQGWHVAASARHLEGWGRSYGFDVSREVEGTQVRFRMSPTESRA